MRTDAKIGFAIGGVLLAVLTVYAIVVPKHKDKKPGALALVTPSTPTGADTPVPTPSPLIGTPDFSNPTPAITPLKDTGTAAMTSVTPPTQPQPPVVTDNMGGGLAGNLIKPDAVMPDAPTRPVIHIKPPRKVNPAPFDVAVDPAPSTDHQYTIKAGQTLSKIAYEVYGNSRFYVAIQRENKGLDPNHLKVGSTIKLPDITPIQPGTTVVSEDHSGAVVDVAPPHIVSPPTVSTDGHTYTVQAGDNLYAISRKMLGTGRKADQIYTMNKDLIGPDKSRLKLGMVLKLPEAVHTAIAE